MRALAFGEWPVVVAPITAESSGRQPLTEAVTSENGMGFHYTHPEHPVVRRAVRLANETGAKDVLALGEGRGQVVRALLQETNVKNVMATDINPRGLDELLDWVRQLGDKLKATFDARIFNAARKEGVPTEGKQAFDLVVAKDVYPFLKPPELTQMLHNAASALKPGGWFILTAPSTRSWTYADGKPTGNPFYRKLSDQAKEHNQTTRSHFSYTSPRYLAQKLEKAGLEMTEVTPYGRENGWLMAVAQKVKFAGLRLVKG